MFLTCIISLSNLQLFLLSEFFFSACAVVSFNYQWSHARSLQTQFFVLITLTIYIVFNLYYFIVQTKIVSLIRIFFSACAIVSFNFQWSHAWSLQTQFLVLITSTIYIVFIVYYFIVQITIVSLIRIFFSACAVVKFNFQWSHAWSLQTQFLVLINSTIYIVFNLYCFIVQITIVFLIRIFFLSLCNC